MLRSSKLELLSQFSAQKNVHTVQVNTIERKSSYNLPNRTAI